MSNFKTTLLNEEKELVEKIEKLYDFSQTDKFYKLDPLQKSLILIQLEAMRTYWRVLVARVNDIEDNFLSSDCASKENGSVITE